MGHACNTTVVNASFSNRVAVTALHVECFSNCYQPRSISKPLTMWGLMADGVNANTRHDMVCSICDTNNGIDDPPGTRDVAVFNNYPLRGGLVFKIEVACCFQRGTLFAQARYVAVLSQQTILVQCVVSCSGLVAQRAIWTRLAVEAHAGADGYYAVLLSSTSISNVPPIWH